VTITLLSDAILTGEDGQPSVSLLKTAEPVEDGSFYKTVTVGNFNRKWGMPLTQALAVSAGSVFVYRATDVTQDQLQTLLQEGIGERRIDGFGRVAVNWHTATYRNIAPPSMKKPENTAPLPSTDESRDLANRMTLRNLRSLLDQQLEYALTRIHIQGEPMRVSQVSRLRQAVLQAANQHDLNVVVKAVEETKSQKKQLERAIVKDHISHDADTLNLLEWLSASHLDTLWDTCIYNPAKNTNPSLAGGVVDDQQLAHLKLEYTTRLLDGLLQVTARRLQAEADEEVG